MERTAHSILLIIIPLLLLGGGRVQGADRKSGANTITAKAFSPATCRQCHPRQYDGYMRSIHSREAALGPLADKGCENCHGDSAGHVLSRGGRGIAIMGFGPATDAGEKSARCLACHYRSPDLAHWELGTHSRNRVSCDVCHTQHSTDRQAMAEPEACFSCHRRVKTEANKRSHHPILEGKLKCSNCHQPHGTLSHGLIKGDDAQRLCYSCHADKRGPAVWTHPPVEENCQTCHRPHGSTHARLLVERVPQLCRNCHDWSRTPGSPYGVNAGANSGRCLQNHPAIHGSSAPSGGGPRFAR